MSRKITKTIVDRIGKKKEIDGETLDRLGVNSEGRENECEEEDGDEK